MVAARMTDEPERAPRTVLTESIGLLALLATRRLYEEQPQLWDLGEQGRARTLEDFTHHLKALANLSEEAFTAHVDYCQQLFAERDFPLEWLTDAWRVMADVLPRELPPSTHQLALAILLSVTGVGRA